MSDDHDRPLAAAGRGRLGSELPPPPPVELEVTRSPYDAFAADYHWIAADEQISGERFLRHYEPALRRLQEGARVLDCACGPGFDALALARAGYRVMASDGSAGMVEQGRASFAAAGVSVPVAQCRWEDLPAAFGEPFDAVLCVGNSIAHSGAAEQMVAAFAGMKAVLREGGLLVVESRDWERLWGERPLVEVRDHDVPREGAKGRCVYRWTIPERWGEPFQAAITVTVERDGGERRSEMLLSFVPYRQEELLDRLVRAGFSVLDVATVVPRRYFVTAQS